MKMETSWVFKKLQELVVRDEISCTSLMKQVRNVLCTTSIDRIIIYDITNEYASLLLTNEEGTIYFYKNLHCSKLKPITKRYTTLLSNLVHQYQPTHNQVNPIPINIKWITTILEMDHQARYRSDTDLLELCTPLDNQIVPVHKRVEKIVTTPSHSTTLSPPSIKIYEPEIIEKIPQPIFDSLDDDKMSVKSTSSTNSTSTITIKYKPQPPPLYRKPSKPIPLELRPKWKR
jgi:hypothetical protein